MKQNPGLRAAPRRLEDLLASAAQKTPDRPALSFRERSVTYGDLDRLSGRVALSLRRRGVRADSRVGVYSEKSPEAVAAIFGVLKSGASYVPLDPASPLPRLASIVADARLQALVTVSSRRAQAGILAQREGPPAPVVFMEELEEGIFSEEAGGAENLAYILYTSGSTGKPKGVAVSHRASMAFVDWAHDCFGMEGRDRVSSHAPFHFDLSIFDIFVTVKAGAVLCLVPSGMAAFPDSLAAFLEKEKISVWYSVPHPLIQLLLYGRLEHRDLSGLRKILYAGEVFPVKFLRELMARLPRAAFFNLYGPTETNVCTYHAVTQLPEGGQAVPIGKPCCGSVALALKDDFAPIGPGETGELYVAGPTLMEGYWGDPGRTREVFTEQLPGHEGVRFYRTGDRVTLDAQGDFVFLGRQDGLIKNKGFRIELGDIEAVLNRHPSVRESCVCVLAGEDGAKRLKAVLTEGAKGPCPWEVVRDFCLQHLPHYMVPDVFEFKSELPRTATGKIDRRALWMEGHDEKDSAIF